MVEIMPPHQDSPAVGHQQTFYILFGLEAHVMEIIETRPAVAHGQHHEVINPEKLQRCGNSRGTTFNY